MRSLFPNSFDLRLLRGPRAEQFNSAPDAFQQLVGDGLKSMVDHHAEVSTTKGIDGSIDVFIEGNCQLTEPFDGLPLPLIIECKSHDDSLGRVAENILAEWGKLSKKLQGQAKENWPGLFTPWKRARGYAYCVSANIPNKQTRSNLQSNIKDFFDSLEPSQRPPIDEIRILDWSDLRGWFDKITSIADAWLGVGLDLILDHKNYCDGLSGFRKYLLASELPFVPPEDDSPLHPDKLLKRLEESVNQRGVMLVGAGGIGKTRTSFEVANRAKAQGWRVLHVLPGEPGITAEDLSEIVLPNPIRTLLIFDYIDQMQRLDLGSIRRSLLPEVNKRGGQLTFLANSRPLWMKTSNPERDELFTVFPLRPSEEQTARVTETVIYRVAPKACNIVGHDEVKRICGGRAIIALLVARELERRAEAGTLPDLDTRTLRTGDLVQWLRRRLMEDKMIRSVTVESLSLAPVKPDSSMVAAAAALACAPGEEEFLVAVAESSISTLSGDVSIAQYLIPLLLELGWLEKHNLEVSTAHDVVADEVFDQTLRINSFVRRLELEAVLSSALLLPRSLGRFATTFGRVIGAIKNEDALRELQNAAVEWMRKNSTELAKCISSGSSDLTSYALGAVLDGPPWDAIAIELWDELFAPWLDQYGNQREARHILYKGLKNVAEGQDILLIEVALKWLDLYSANSEDAILEASYVLGPLISRRDLKEDQAARAVEYAEAWLDKFRQDLSASYVFGSLLGRNDLKEDQVTRIVEHADTWLDKFRQEAPTARYVLGWLLGRNDLKEDQVTRIVEHADAWLVRFRQEDLSASYVFGSLLGRNDLKEDQVTKAVEHADAWLDKFRQDLSASYVLSLLLSRNDLNTIELKSKLKQTISYACEWLIKHHAKFDAGFVLPPLLKRKELDEQQSRIIVEKAISWLNDFFNTQDAEFVLKNLLNNSAVPRKNLLDLLHAALKMLQSRLDDKKADYILHWCLRTKVYEPHLDRELLLLAIQWLDIHFKNPDADFVWNRVLRRREVSDKDWKRIAKYAFLWLEGKTIDTPQIDFTLNSILSRTYLLEPLDQEVILKLVINWLEKNASSKEKALMVKRIPFLLNKLSVDQQLINDLKAKLHAEPEYTEPEPVDAFSKLIKRLNYLAFNPAVQIEPEELTEVCQTVSEKAQVSPQSSSYAVAPLLVLGLRLGEPHLTNVKDVAATILNDDRLPTHKRQRIVRLCEGFLEKKAFPDEDEAVKTLKEIKLFD
jgi:hypothetical protein